MEKAARPESRKKASDTWRHIGSFYPYERRSGPEEPGCGTRDRSLFRRSILRKQRMDAFEGKCGLNI